MSALPPIATSIAVFRISALGQKRTFAPQQVMSTFPLKADIEAGPGFKLVQSANLTYVFRCERVRCRALLISQVMKPDGQQTIGGSTLKLAIALWAFIVFCTVASIAHPDSLDDVYTTRAVVTGKDERNRPLGFKLCFEDVLVKASGDASIVNDSRFEAFAAGAEQYVSSFSYRDRLEGKPVHDEQGTYDRPHFLTCRFDPQKIDSVLKTFGRKPWLTHRPRLSRWSPCTAASTAASFRATAHSIQICAKRWPTQRNATAYRSVCRVSQPSDAIRLVLIQLCSPGAINGRTSLRCRAASYYLSATCNGTMEHSDGSQPGASRRAGTVTAGQSEASTTTKRFGTLSEARHGCYLVTVNLYEVWPLASCGSVPAFRRHLDLN